MSFVQRFNVTDAPGALNGFDIVVQELKLKITKYQYQDFAMLLHSFNSLILAARYRKYKVSFPI
jgi:hypothetical protein